MKIEIVNEDVTTKSGTSRFGKPFSMRIQMARVALNGEVRNIQLVLESDQAPYPKGAYRLSDESFYVGGYGDLQVRPVLEPVVAAQAKAS